MTLLCPKKFSQHLSSFLNITQTTPKNGSFQHQALAHPRPDMPGATGTFYNHKGIHHHPSMWPHVIISHPIQRCFAFHFLQNSQRAFSKIPYCTFHVFIPAPLLHHPHKYFHCFNLFTTQKSTHTRKQKNVLCQHEKDSHFVVIKYLQQSFGLIITRSCLPANLQFSYLLPSFKLLKCLIFFRRVQHAIA